MWCVSVFSLLRRGFEREQEKGEREKEGCKGLWEGEKASFHLPRDPSRAHYSVPQSCNRFSSLACSPSPLKIPGTSAEERVSVSVSAYNCMRQ